MRDTSRLSRAALSPWISAVRSKSRAHILRSLPTSTACRPTCSRCHLLTKLLTSSTHSASCIISMPRTARWRGLVRTFRPGARLRIYLYWKRHGWKGRLLEIVSTARRVTTRVPFPVLPIVSRVLSIGLFGGVVLPYRLLSAAGVRAPRIGRCLSTRSIRSACFSTTSSTAFRRRLRSGTTRTRYGNCSSARPPRCERDAMLRLGSRRDQACVTP